MAGKEGENVRLMEENERLSEQVGLLNLDLCPRCRFVKHVYFLSKFTPLPPKKIMNILFKVASSVERPAAEGEEASKVNGHIEVEVNNHKVGFYFFKFMKTCYSLVLSCSY